MVWAKLSDDYSDDCWTLSDAAFRLHTEALVWNGRKLLDCRLPKEDLRRFASIRTRSTNCWLAAGGQKMTPTTAFATTRSTNGRVRRW